MYWGPVELAIFPRIVNLQSQQETLQKLHQAFIQDLFIRSARSADVFRGVARYRSLNPVEVPNLATRLMLEALEESLESSDACCIRRFARAVPATKRRSTSPKTRV